MELALILLAIRFAVGLTSTALMGYVTYGFRHAASWGTIRATLRHPSEATPSDLMVLALTAFHVKGIMRLGFWDVLAVALGVLGVLPFSAAIYVSAVNIGLGLIAGIACLITMYAQYRMIPEGERSSYSMWTAPKYPWARARKRESLRRATEAEGGDVNDLRHDLVNCQTTLRAMARAHLDGAPYADDMARSALSED